MIRDFQEYSATIASTESLDTLAAFTVGIEATEYLNMLPKFPVADVSRPIKEALLPALGGLPLGLRFVIQKTISVWRQHKVTPVFVFSGLDFTKRDATFAASEASAAINAEAWALYDSHEPVKAVEMFGQSTSVTAEDMFRYLQSILREEGVEFVVAPYGASAQLSYLYSCGTIDTIYGSSEVLFYDVPDLITGWDFQTSEFTFVKRQTCLRDLGNISSETFVDACLLAGSSVLPTLPQLDRPDPKRNNSKIRTAVDIVNNIGRGSGYAVCQHFQNDPAFIALDYLDRFRKARSAIRFHIVLTADGRVQPLRDDPPRDIHLFIGQRLPDEIYHYLSRGVIGPRVLNWRTSGEIIEKPPLDNGESEQYRHLVRDQLTEMRTTAIALLSFSLNRYYHHTDINLRCWFDKEHPKVIHMKEATDPRPVVSQWNVPISRFGPEINKYPQSSLLSLCIKTLTNPNFAEKSITPKSFENQPLSDKDELLLNAVWRFLHLRGYINKDHSLTAWGRVLHTTLAALPSPHQEEAAILAIELARLGLLNANPMFLTYSGAPYRGTEETKRFILLISRVACLGRFSHKEIGYTGPLSRHLLGFHSMITAVRNGLRDLMEVCMTTLLLNGDATRDEDKDLTDLGLDLPFLLHNDCGLGLAVNSYLDEVSNAADPSAPETKKAAKTKGSQVLFLYSLDYAVDIDKAFALWDAVYKGLKTAGDMFPHQTVFDDANEFLSKMR